MPDHELCPPYADVGPRAEIKMGGGRSFIPARPCKVHARSFVDRSFYRDGICTAPIDANSADVKNAIAPGSVVTMRPMIAGGTPRSS